jgi:tetratricopeptide (TPR) repeat protein
VATKEQKTQEQYTEADKKWPVLARSIEQAMAAKQYKDAEELTLFALELMEEYDDSDPRLIQTLQTLSRIYYATERYGNGAPVLKRLIKIYTRLTGAKSVETSTIVQNAALLYHYWGKKEEAERYFKEAIEAKTLLLGEKDPQVIKLQTHYIKFLEDNGRKDEAYRIKEKILRTKQTDTMSRTGRWETMQPGATQQPLS